jgi:CRISPR-associated protein Csb2
VTEGRETLSLTVRFLRPMSHGRGADGAPEWPPSPLRVYQAMIASGLGKADLETARGCTREALQWLESLPAPDILATAPLEHADGSARTSTYRSYVPDNVGDRVAGTWSRGGTASIAEYRTAKDVCSLMLPEDARVSYEYACAGAEIKRYLPEVRRLMRSVTHVGWGVDQVVGDASTGEVAGPGIRWQPRAHGTKHLRVPVPGSLAGLDTRYNAFLGRLPGSGVFVPVPPLSAFARARYAPSDSVPSRPVIAFRLVQPDTGDRLAFDPTRRARDVAAWLRHRVGEAVQQWPYGDARTLVHGHMPATLPATSGPTPRFSYLPLPTVAPFGKGRARRATDIARVALVAPDDKGGELLWLEQQLLQQDLVWEGRRVATLEFLPAQDSVLQAYLGGERGSHVWSSVTPVVLPGLDDRAEKKTERLLRLAFEHAGFPAAVVAQLEVDWSKTGFVAGVAHADRYLAPHKVSGPQYHVRVRFPGPTRGPVAIGSGRHRGLGTFVASEGAA